MTTTIRDTTLLALDTFRADRDGCLAYLVADEASRTALAIDPRLDQIDEILEALATREVRLTHVLDTHTHADHLSGVRRLAQRTGAAVLAHAVSKLKQPARRITGGTTFQLGTKTVTVLDAPGHTPDSLAILVDGHLFTGDALFAGGAGRTDFMGGSASDLFDTLRAFEALPDDTVVHPGHDYVGRPVTTIGEEKAGNPLLREHDRGAFVARLSGRAVPPANMAVILRHNLGEVEAPSIAPRDLQTLREQASGTSEPLILDVRSPLEFDGERIEGARLIPLDELEGRLDEIPDQAEVIVVCRTGVRATIAAEMLARAGRRPRVLEGGMMAWRRARLPVREGRKRLPVDRQVQLIAGGMVLTGLALGTLVNPWFLAISAFFGAGLTFAGATGTCGLALVLLRMPWNRPRPVPSAGPTAVCAAGGGGPRPVRRRPIRGTDRAPQVCQGDALARGARDPRAALSSARRRHAPGAPPGPVRPRAHGPGAVRAGRHDPGECEQAPGAALRAGPRGAPAGRSVHSLPDRGPHARAALSSRVRIARRTTRGHAHPPRVLARSTLAFSEALDEQVDTREAGRRASMIGAGIREERSWRGLAVFEAEALPPQKDEVIREGER